MLPRGPPGASRSVRPCPVAVEDPFDEAALALLVRLPSRLRRGGRANGKPLVLDDEVCDWKGEAVEGGFRAYGSVRDGLSREPRLLPELLPT